MDNGLSAVFFKRLHRLIGFCLPGCRPALVLDTGQAMYVEGYVFQTGNSGETAMNVTSNQKIFQKLVFYVR